MKIFIALTILVASVNCQTYQPAFESFMSRNRDLFSTLATSTSAGSQQFGQQTQPIPQWQQPQSQPSFANSFTPSISPSSASNSGEPFVTSNSHIQAFNPPQGSGSPTTISGPNFQTSISLPAIPALPQHQTASSAPQQQQQFQAQPQSQPQLTHHFSTHVHNHQIPSTSSAASGSFAPSVGQQSSGIASTSFFNSQGTNTNFPFNFPSPASVTAAPLNLPTPSTTPSSSRQTFGNLGFSSFQTGNNFFNQQQPQPVSLSTPSSTSFGLTSNTIRAPGFETFVFMRPSEQPVQGAALRKVIRSPNGIDKEIFYVPMPNYSPPSVYNYQTVHSNGNVNQQQQGRQ